MSQALGHWITPPEVYQIASELKAAANKIEAVFTQVNQVDNQLDQSWLGNAKNIFDSHFNGFPKEILAYAQDLKQMADEVLAIQIWVPYE
jgi:uncharacterized protein YukE